MTDPEFPATSASHLAAVSEAVPEAAFAEPEDESVEIFNFRFAHDMMPGWTLARAREVETGRGVRLAQVNARAEGSDNTARIEIFETDGPDAARELFLETLARFQRDPATILRTPPQVGEAEAAVGQSMFVFLRGNLVVTVAAIGPVVLPVEDLARQLDRSIRAKPEAVEEDLAEDAAPMLRAAAERPMVKVFTRRAGRRSGESERFSIAANGLARRIREPGGERPGEEEG
jgi:hypothetical protein